MADNETRIKLTAVDGVTATLSSIQRATGELTGGLSRLQGAFAALGATAALGGLAASIKSAIDTADALEELGQKTGIAVEQLSALDFAMRREGVSTEAFAKGMKELSKSMVEAGDASSKAGKLFAALGVDSTAGPRQALLQLADAFASMPDGATKAALATEIFGKAGMDLIPALNQGAAGIQELEQQARRLGVTLNEETAKGAAAFKDNLFALQESSKALGVSMAKDLLPGLKDITSAMREAAEEGGILNAIWVGLGGVGNFLINGTEIQQTKKEISDLQGQIEELNRQASTADGAMLEGIVKALDTLQPKLDAAEAKLKRLTDTASGKGAGGPSAAGKARENAARGILAGGGKPAAAFVDGLDRDLDALLLRLDSAALGFSQEFPKSLSILNAAFAAGTISVEDYGRAVDKLLAQQPVFRAEIEAEAKSMERRVQLRREEQEEEVAAINARNAVIFSLRDGNEALRVEIETLGMSTLAREKYLLKLEEERDLKSALDDADEERIRAYYREKEALLETRAAREEQASIYSELADRGASFFADLAVSGKDAFKNLERSLKDFARELIAVFAKRYILNMAASLTNNPSLAALAGQQGQGTLAGSLGNFGTFGSLLSSGGGMLASGLNTIGLGGASQFVGGLTGSIAGPALPGSALAAGQGFGSMFAAAGPYLAAAAAVYALYQAFNDGPENWKGRLGFGSMANAYTTDGIFGREGFAYIEGTDATNRSIQQFMASTGAIDRQLSRNLTEEQIATITARIAQNTGAGSRRSDGQSAEFAFEADDSTAAGQLTLEYLKQKYGPVFDEIDGEFAEFIRGYTGKSEDLLKAIADFAGVLEGLDSLSVAGLDITALRAMQLEGEELTATFTRVAGAVSNYRQLFTTEAEALGLAQASIAAGFAEIGLAIPASKEEFKKLVEGLDLTTEAGRTAFQALMNVAPAFAAVADAAAGLLSDFDSIMGRLRPGYSGQMAQQGLESATRRFMELNPWASGMDWRYIAQQITTITREDFQAYDAESQRLINQILGYTAEIDGAAGSVQDFGSVVDYASGAIESYAQAMLSAKDGIADWLNGLFLSDLSPLTSRERFDFAGDAYVENLIKAQSGDVGALASFTGFADAYLKEARDFFASGDQYQRIFAAITGQAANLAGLADARPYTAGDSQKATAAIVQAIRDLEQRVALLDKNQQLAVSKQTGALVTPLGV